MGIVLYIIHHTMGWKEPRGKEEHPCGLRFPTNHSYSWSEFVKGEHPGIFQDARKKAIMGWAPFTVGPLTPGGAKLPSPTL